MKHIISSLNEWFVSWIIEIEQPIIPIFLCKKSTSTLIYSKCYMVQMIGSSMAEFPGKCIGEREKAFEDCDNGLSLSIF